MTIITGMPIEEYHDLPSISNSGLNDFARSPFHFYKLHLDPLRPPRKEKPGQLEGNLAHCALLEPNEFSKRYVIGPDVNRNTKEWKLIAESIHPDATLIKPDQHDAAFAQAASALSIPEVADLLSVGDAEISAFWTDKETGVECRCRPDFAHPTGHGVILADAKTYSSSDTTEFARQVERKGYYKQAAWYSDGYESATGIPVLGFVFIVMENDYPFGASACILDDKSLELGRTENRTLLSDYAKCLTANAWPRKTSGIELISLSRWKLSTTFGE